MMVLLQAAQVVAGDPGISVDLATKAPFVAILGAVLWFLKWLFGTVLAEQKAAQQALLQAQQAALQAQQAFQMALGERFGKVEERMSKLETASSTGAERLATVHDIVTRCQTQEKGGKR